MNRTPLSYSDAEIIESLLGNCDSVMSKEQVQDRFLYLLCMLTERQKQQLLKKVKRCDHYLRLIEKGVDSSKVRSIVKRRHGIKRQHIEYSCLPCKTYYSYKKSVT